MFCKKCGSEINDDAVICVKCGCSTKEEPPVPTAEQLAQKKKINVLCLVGFVLSLVSLLIALYGTVAIAGMVLSIIGLVQANRTGERLKGLGIAGIVVSAGSLIYTVYSLIVLASLLAVI